MKLFTSGSASIGIQRRARESLAGRMYDFHLDPLHLREFLELKGLKVAFEDREPGQSRVLPLFWDFARKGGFPEITDEESDDKIGRYIRSAVLDRILLMDPPGEFGLRDRELLEFLTGWIFREGGVIANYEELSKKTGKTRSTLANYIAHLEYAMVIRVLGNLRPGFSATSRKMRKLCPANTAFQRYHQGDRDIGSMLETFVLQELGPGN